MPAPKLPAELTAASWDKHKGLLAKAKPTGVGEALRDLAKAHGAIDFRVFDAVDHKTSAEAEAQLARQDAEIAKSLQAASAKAAKAAMLARKAEAEFKASKLIPKAAAAAAADVASAADAYVVELGRAAAGPQADLRRLIADLKAEESRRAAAEEAEEASLDKLKAMVTQAMRLARTSQGDAKAKPVNFMIGAKDRTVMAYVTPKSVGETQKKVLKKLIGSESGVKFYQGEVGFDPKRKAWMFKGETIPTGGFAKQLQTGLKGLTGTGYKLCVQRPTGEVDEVDGVSDDEATATPPEGASPADGAAAKALLQRLVTVQALLTKLVAGGGERAAQITKVQQQAKAAVLALQLGEAERLIAGLEALATPGKGGATPPSDKTEATGGTTPPPTTGGTGTTPKDAGKAGPGDAAPATRASARQDLDTVLGQVTALVLGAINDDGLRKTVNDALGELKAKLEQADKIGPDAQAIAGYRAVKIKADALLVQAQSARELAEFLASDWDPAAKAAATAAAALTAAGAKKVLEQRLGELQAARGKAVTAVQPAALKPLLADLKKIAEVAAAVAHEAGQADTQIAAAAQSIGEMGADASGALQETLRDLQARRAGADWPGGASVDAIAGALAAFAAEVKRLTEATGAMRKLFDAKQAYEKGFAELKAAYDRTVGNVTNFPDIFLDAPKKKFADADRSRTEAVDAGEWVDALGALAALRIAIADLDKVVDDFVAYDNARKPKEAAIETARHHCYANTGGMPKAESEAFWEHFNAVDAEADKRAWKAAKTALDKLLVAVAAVEKVVKAGKAYYDAFEAQIGDDAYDAFFAARDGKSGAVPARAVDYRAALKATQDLAKAKDWSGATASLPKLRKAIDALLAAKQAFATEKAPFEEAFVKITEDLARARAIAAAPPKKLKGAQVKDFREKFAVVNDARNTGRFADGVKALPALEAAIRALLEAKAKWDAERGAYETALATLTTLEEARRLAASPAPAMAEAATAFKEADDALAQSVRAEDWVNAEKQAKALRDKLDALFAAKDAFNSTAGGADGAGAADLRERVRQLEPRTAKAGEDKVPLFVDYLQRAVRDRLDEIERWIAAPDLAAAEAAFGQLEPALVAMEQGKAALARHRAKYDAARDGDVKKARDTALQPAALAKARDDAFAKTEREIALLVDKNLLPQADARVARWITEANAWVGAKKAYDALTSGAPSKATLKALGDKPGGGEVLDALVASLPPETTQKVMSTALEARFGFTVKRFQKAKDDAGDLTGLAPLPENKADKSLQQIYKVLADVPESHLKGKVTELIAFDENTGGAMFSNDERKIYMYCGRPDNAGQKVLGQASEIVPEGETIDPECEPANKEPVQEFDHALLHEAGHGQDLATRTMVDKDRKGDKAFGAWILHGAADEVATVAAKHFKADRAYVLTTLKTPGSVPPKKLPDTPPGRDAEEWKAAHKAAVDWCKLVRVDNKLWDQPALSRQVAIDGRTYHEAYAGRWVSYDVSTRTQGISAYQFRSEWEWFAELYAAYFTGKLKPSHPACAWLDKMKSPT